MIRASELEAVVREPHRAFRFIHCADRAAWLQERRQRIQASECAAACGLDPFLSKFALYAEKAGLLGEAPAVEDDLSEAAYWGTVLEDPIARRFSELAERPIIDHGRWTIAVNDDFPNVGATLDREIPPIAGDDGPGVLEVKAPGFLQRDRWTEGPPTHILLQVHAQLLVTGWRWGIVAALFGGQDLRTFRVERDDDLLAAMLEHVDEFWRCVRYQTAPAPDASESSKETLRRLFPRDNGAEIDLPDLAAIAAEFEAAKVIHKEAERRVDALRNVLAAAIGHATTARIGSHTYTYKTVDVGTYTVKSFTKRELRRKGEPT